MGMKIMRYDDSITSAMDANQTKAYLADQANWGTIEYTARLAPT